MTVRLSQREFDNLSEYSCTIPTGKTIGKQWKRREPYGAPPERAQWIRGEYVDIGEEGMVGIEWREIEVETPRATQVRKALTP